MSLGTVATLLLIPPVNLLPVAMAGVAVAWRRPRIGLPITAAALVLTWLFSTPLISGVLSHALEAGMETPPIAYPEAIVILSAEEHEGAPGGIVTGVDSGTMTLERLRAGARLAKQTHLPVLTSGGDAKPGWPSLAETMAMTLRRDFAVQTYWMETRSSDTWQNAFYSATILKAEKIRTVYVVTHAWHMRRALIAFRAAGMEAIPAPVLIQPPLAIDWLDLMPTPNNWVRSYLAVHEWIGCAVYALRARWR